jgi:hypothetical protein
MFIQKTQSKKAWYLAKANRMCHQVPDPDLLLHCCHLGDAERLTSREASLL